MRLVHTGIATPIRVMVAVCAPLCSAAAVQGETFNIRDLMVFYTSQSAGGAQGTIEFILRFASFDGPATNYDSFSAQLMINQLVRGAPSIFTLDATATGDTSSIGPEYWLPSAGTDPLASTQDGELRFRDRVSLAAPPNTPSTDEILAHYVIGFNVGPGGFGSYRIAMGSATSNFFARSILPPTLNTLVPDSNEDTFMLVAPEPASALLVLLGGTMLLRRNRRRSRT